MKQNARETSCKLFGVAPLAGAWIETTTPTIRLLGSPVAPLAGAWIETEEQLKTLRKQYRRPPRGGVD